MSGPQRMQIEGGAPSFRRVPTWRKPLLIPKHAHPFVRHLYREMNAQRVTMLEVAEISGLRRQTIWDWANRHPPRVDQMEAALNAVGLRLAVEKLPDD